MKQVCNLLRLLFPGAPNLKSFKILSPLAAMLAAAGFLPYLPITSGLKNL
jgi:hypothetical protein